jgi:NAD(P)H dehydrogenase (quinone)
MILITGATGNLGSKVIEALLKRVAATEIAALVRDENKAQDLKEKGISIRIGDYDSKGALDQAMRGVDKVLLVSGGRAANGLQQHQNVVDAAKKAGVKTFAYTSRCLQNPETLSNQLMKRHFLTEEYILSTGMNYIFFRNILYMEAMVTFLGKNVLETGIHLPAGDGRGSYALRSDQAEAIGNVLATEGNSKRVYDFTNCLTYSFDDIASALSVLSGRKVSYTSVDTASFQLKAAELGIPEFAVDVVTAFVTDIKNGQESKVSTDMESALGRKPVGLQEGLKQLFGL